MQPIARPVWCLPLRYKHPGSWLVLPVMAFNGQVWGKGEHTHSELTHESLFWRIQSAGQDYVQEVNFWPKMSEDHWSRQSVGVTATERPSSLADSPLLVAFLVSTVIVGAQLLPLLMDEMVQLIPSFNAGVVYSRQ